MRGHLVAHQRNADEIGDLLVLDQPQCLGRIPFGHQHQLARNGEALQKQRDFAGDVEQRNGNQRTGLGRNILALTFEQHLGHRALRDIVHDPRHHAEMVGIGALRLAGRSRGVENGRKIVGTQRAEHRHGDRCLETFRRLPYAGEPLGRSVVVDHYDLCAVFGPFEAGGAAGIGEHQLALRKTDAIGQFVTVPEPVEQRRAAACHRDTHIGDHPVGRIARRQTDAVALVHTAGDERLCHRHRGLEGLAEGHADIPVDEEFLVLMLVAVMRHQVEHRRRRGLQGRQLDSVTFVSAGFQRSAGRGQRVHDCCQLVVECRCHSCRSPVRSRPVRVCRAFRLPSRYAMGRGEKGRGAAGL